LEACETAEDGWIQLGPRSRFWWREQQCG